MVAVLAAFQVVLASRFSLAYNDFSVFYTGARAAAEGHLASLHDEAEQKRIQAPFVPAGRYPAYFVRLQAWAALLLPFGLMPFRTSFVVWVMVQGLILGSGWIWAARRFGIDAAVLAAMFPPAILSIGFGQDTAFWFGLVLLSWILFEHGHPLGAGACLGLCVIKPHLIFVVPVALLIQRRWRMLTGFLSGCAAMVGGSMVLGGWQTLPRYAAFLRGAGGVLLNHHEGEMNVSSILINAGLPLSLRYVLMAAVVAAVVLACRGTGWETGLMAAMLASFLIAPHTGNYDATSLLVGAWLTVFRAATMPVRVLATAFFTPIPWLLQILDPPWTGVPALLLFCLLMAMAWERFRATAPTAAGRSGMVDPCPQSP